MSFRFSENWEFRGFPMKNNVEIFYEFSDKIALQWKILMQSKYRIDLPIDDQLCIRIFAKFVTIC